MAANEIQVGGDHYRKHGDLQPWDVIHRLGLGFFEGTIFKYLVRWRDKGGVEDLKKARHFLDKLIELNDASSLHPSQKRANTPRSDATMKHLVRVKWPQVLGTVEHIMISGETPHEVASRLAPEVKLRFDGATFEAHHDVGLPNEGEVWTVYTFVPDTENCDKMEVL